MFYVVRDFSNSKVKEKQCKQKTSPKGYKTEIIIHANPGLAQSCFEQPSQECSTSIYVCSYITYVHNCAHSQDFFYNTIPCLLQEQHLRLVHQSSSSWQHHSAINMYLDINLRILLTNLLTFLTVAFGRIY